MDTNAWKNVEASLKEQDAIETLYPDSPVRVEDCGLALARDAQGEKWLIAAARTAAQIPSGIEGRDGEAAGFAVRIGRTTPQNARLLQDFVPWTRPVSLRNRRTTFGCGDRLGLATAGHVRAIRRYAVAPVLAQQSIRELTLTRRTFRNVVDDVAFLVFQEGWSNGFGADGDHLKTIEDIDTALDAGMTMITLDVSERMNAEAAQWDAERVARAFAEFPGDLRRVVLDRYADRDFDVEGHALHLSAAEVRRCLVMYGHALEFAGVVFNHLRKRRGERFDLELSIDETTAPTLPEHHYFIARELERRGVVVSSLAPRFIGEFQKGIDYRGDLGEFERHLIVHCAIARAAGGYKISVHSGSDKFAVYPAIGRHTRLRVHVKTAGTSWLEALRTIAMTAPGLFRRIHQRAFEFLPEARRYYHITPDLEAVPDVSKMPDAALPGLLDHDDERQVLHVSYGGILHQPGIGPEFFAVMKRNETAYIGNLVRHFTRHLDALGAPPA